MLFLAGCSPADTCDRALMLEWGKLATLRVDQDAAATRPTEEQRTQLRSTIEDCALAATAFNYSTLESGIVGQDTVINLATELDDPALLDWLVTNGHSADGLPNTSNVTTLQMAARRAAPNALRWALERGVDPNLRDENGVAALFWATFQIEEGPALIDQLLRAGANVNAEDAEGRSVLLYALSRANYENARILIEAGSDLLETRSRLVENVAGTRREMSKDRANAALDFVDEILAAKAAE